MSKLPAPSSFTAEVLLISNHYNAILLGQTGNYLEFGFDIKNNNGQSQVDNIQYTALITRNANQYTVMGSCAYGKTVSINLDQYLTQEGTTTVTLEIRGQSTNVSATTMITYEVVNLNIINDYDVSSIYKLEDGDPVVLTYKVSGSSNVKYVEWYIDGEYDSVDILTGGTSEALTKTKYFSIQNFTGGVHNVQFRAYVDINGDKFYTNTLYREFIVVDSTIDNVVMSIESVIPSNYGIISDPKLYGAVQYEPYTFYYGVYNKANLEYVSVEIYIDDDLMQTVNAPNEKELSYTFISQTSGDHVIKLISNGVSKTINMSIAPTTMNIYEVTDNLELSLSAVGKTNNDIDKNN